MSMTAFNVSVAAVSGPLYRAFARKLVLAAGAAIQVASESV
jgi:hypothetical protein